MESTEHTGTWEGEKVAFLFQHGTVLPVQCFETISRKAQLEPEKRLTLAILQDAADCFQKYMFARNDRGRALFDETEQWIMEENTDWLFSFESICEGLGFEPKYIRKGLLLWKNSHLTQQGSGMSQRSEVQCR